MSEYIYNTVTSYGAALIAQATAANPIVIVGALSKATAASGAQELATAPVSWYDGRTGDIATVSATGSVARIVAVFRNAGGSRQAAKSIAVTARLASQTDGEAVVLAAISDPASTIELPAEADTGQAVEFPINIAINPGGTITVTPGASASVADLDRFVSLHAPGQPTTGEVQTIYGEKTFTDGIRTGRIAGLPDESILLYSNIFPSPDDSTIMLGDSNHPFAYIQANGGVITGLATDTLGSTAGNTPITLNNSIIPAYDDVELGGEDDKFLSVYAENIHGLVPNLYTRSAQTPEDYNPAVPVGAIAMLNLRKSDYSVFAQGARVAAGEIIPSGGGTLHDGTTFGWVHIAQYRLGSSGDLSIDNEYTTNASRGDLGTNMKFRAICGVRTTVSNSNILPVLAMRIE